MLCENQTISTAKNQAWTRTRSPTLLLNTSCASSFDLQGREQCNLTGADQFPPHTRYTKPGVTLRPGSECNGDHHLSMPWSVHDLSNPTDRNSCVCATFTHSCRDRATDVIFAGHCVTVNAARNRFSRKVVNFFVQVRGIRICHTVFLPGRSCMVPCENMGMPLFVRQMYMRPRDSWCCVRRLCKAEWCMFPFVLRIAAVC